MANTTSTSGVYSVTVDRTAPSAALEITGSGYKVIEEKIVNGGLKQDRLLQDTQLREM